MDSRRMYLSNVGEDSDDVRPLRTVLEAVGITIVAAQTELISGTDQFLACFSTGADGATRYQSDELEHAIEQVRGMPPGWLTLVKLTPCVIPELPGLPTTTPLLDLKTNWSGAITQLLTPASRPGESTFTFNADQYMAGGNASWINADSEDGSIPPDMSVRSDINIKTVVVDGNSEFIGFRKRGR